MVSRESDGSISSKGPLYISYAKDDNGKNIYIADFHLKRSDDTPLYQEGDSEGNFLLTTTAQEIGDYIMIPPLDASVGAAKLKLYITLRDNAGSRYTTVNPIEVTPPADGWQSGKSYPLSVTLSDPIKVIASAAVQTFVEDDDYSPELSDGE